MKRSTLLAALLCASLPPLACGGTSAVPNNTGPNNTGPNNTGPNNTGPNNTGPNNTGPSNTVPSNTVPNNTAAAEPVEVPAGEASASPTLVSVPASPPRASATTPADGAASPVSAPPRFHCALDAPVVSGDPCSSDADCAPSDPCHAHACVAVAKANPATVGTMCTRMMDCRSVDANRCGCYQGHCALIPPP